jgi:ribonucleoside-diphosphate reductase alpha subunit
MFVVKRNGDKQTMLFDKITARINILMDEANIYDIDAIAITKLLVQRIISGISTAQIDELACQIIMSKVHEGQKYGKLASRLAISNHHKTTSSSFKEVIKILRNNKDPCGEIAPLVSEEIEEFVDKHGNIIEDIIHHERDYLIDYFGICTLKKAYLIKSNGQYIERPQHLFMRVALGIHGMNSEPDFDRIKRTYDGLSLQKYMHATPTLFHAGTPRPQLASCFLIGTEDSVEGIYGTITDCAKISKWAGGIGVHIHNIRSEGSYIRKTGGRSDGIMPMLKVYDSTARYINQSGKRNGSFAMYLEPWHADIIKFLHAKRAQGVEEERARDLFYALWVPDLFMERVQADKMWSLMCPDECKGLSDCYGDEFVTLYEKYEKEGKYKSQTPARKLWENIVTCQIESGVPYMCYKDASNKKSNQNNIGVIKSSNLCAEIIQYSDDKNPSVCNLASISLKSILKNPKNVLSEIIVISKTNCFYCKLLKYFLTSRGIYYTELVKENKFNSDKIQEIQEKYGDINYKTVPQVFGKVDDNEFKFLGGFWSTWEYLRPVIDYNQLKEIAEDLTYNLNKIIDRNFYPLEGAKKSNFEHRPIGIGVQGLADMFAEMLVPFDSDLAKKINKEIFETIYYGCMKASVDLAQQDGPYASFEGSLLSKGQFQFNLWGLEDNDLSGLWEWGGLRDRVLKYGARNSLLTALMPTASSAQILGNNECFEPFTSNIYTRSTIAGEFTMINNILMKLLENIGLWNKDFENKMIYHRGSVQNITELPQDFKNVFKTVWEISQKKYIELSAERGPFICQSQSLNIWFSKPTFGALYKAHMLSWSLGLKTGSYYVRQLPASNAQRLGMSASVEKSLKEDSICDSCSA